MNIAEGFRVVIPTRALRPQNMRRPRLVGSTPSRENAGPTAARRQRRRVRLKPRFSRWPQHADQRMTAVLAGASVGENLACHRAEAERVVEFPVREQTGVGGDYRSLKLEDQAAVEIELERLAVRFTRRVRRESSLQISIRC